MKTRDYILFTIGFLILAFGYVLGFEDIQLGDFLHGFGSGVVFIYVIKGLWLLISKKKARTDSN